MLQDFVHLNINIRPHIFSIYNETRSIVEKTPHSHVQRYFCHKHRSSHWRCSVEEGAGENTNSPSPPCSTSTIFGSYFFFYVQIENKKFLLVNNIWHFIYWIRHKWQKVDSSFLIYRFSSNTLNSCYTLTKLLCNIVMYL